MKLLFLTRAKALKSLVIASAMMFGLASCQTGVDSLVPTETSVAEGIAGGSAKDGGVVASAEEIRTANTQLEEIAKAVAVVVADKETATWLHKKCMEKFDGETNVLWKYLDVDANRGWTDKIIHKVRSLGAADSKATLNRTISRIGQIFGGNVHVYWFNAEQWDGKTTPIVAYTPLDEQLGKRTTAPGFDANGTSLIINEDVMKGKPVLVVTRNERTDANGKLRTPRSMSSKQTQGQLQAQNSRLRIYRTSFPAHYEDIFSGDPDFEATIRTTVDGVSVTEEYPGFNLFGGVSRADCDSRWADGWVGQWDRSFGWDSVTHKTLYIKWYEYDPPPIFGGGKLTLSLEAEFKIGETGTLKPGVKFEITLPTTTSTPLQGWAIHNDAPPMPGTTIRALYNGGNPSIEFKFDPLY